MPDKILTGDCTSCESIYTMSFSTEMTADDEPTYCPFCGEIIENYIDDEIEDEDDDWNESDE